MRLQVVPKTPFIEFVGTFMEIPYDIRKDILLALENECPYTTLEQNLTYLFEQVYDESVEDDSWSNLFKQLGVYRERFIL